MIPAIERTPHHRCKIASMDATTKRSGTCTLSLAEDLASTGREIAILGKQLVIVDEDGTM